jgi:predicted GNAT family N-acyltransferase
MTGPGATGFFIGPLSPARDREGFQCGEPVLDAYLQRQARQDMTRNLARVYVLTNDGKTVNGFYSLSATAIDSASLPSQISRKLPHFSIPAALLGRMAIDTRLQGRNLGNLLLMSALRKALDGSRDIGSWAVVVDAKQSARAFYLKSDFQPFPDDPTRLFITLAHFARSTSGIAVAE